MTDSIETIGQLQLHHGKSNDRMYVLEYGDWTPFEVNAYLMEMNKTYDYGKIIVKAHQDHRQAFEACGYVEEARIPGYNKGQEDCLYMVSYLKEERIHKGNETAIKELLKTLAHDKRRSCIEGSSTYKIRPLTKEDSEQIAQVFMDVFETYPFPVYDSKYIRQTMDTHIVYYGVMDGNQLVAVSSAEMNKAKKNVEMTDFAILPSYRGQKLSRYLLRVMEEDMVKQGMKTAFTIARSLSFPMNKSFYQGGYCYGGTLWNNTQIGGGIESMNVWSKSLRDNLIIEGLQGSGKSTLLMRLRQEIDGYNIVYEGDLSPIDLKWCAFVTELEYKRIRKRYPELATEFERNSHKEDDHYSIAYTRIITDIPSFHKEMGTYEIYDGQCSFEEFKAILFKRMEAFDGNHQVFEGAFFHHTIDTLLLFYELERDAIIAFYDGLYTIVEQNGIQILYLKTPSVEQRINRITKERGDIHGQPMWQPVMLNYLKSSPYGKRHKLTTHEDLIAYLQQRETLAQEIIDRHEGIISIIL